MGFEGHFLAIQARNGRSNMVQCRYARSMLAEIYIEALLVDEDLADQVWYMWAEEQIEDDLAWIAWMLIAIMIS